MVCLRTGRCVFLADEQRNSNVRDENQVIRLAQQCFLDCFPRRVRSPRRFFERTGLLRRDHILHSGFHFYEKQSVGQLGGHWLSVIG